MRSILAFPVCAALLFSSSYAFAAADMPAVGTYGFDWLNPNKVHCIAISKALIKKFRKCETTDGSFGGDPIKARKCTINKNSEYMVYESKAACVDGMGNAEANE